MPKTRGVWTIIFCGDLRGEEAAAAGPRAGIPAQARSRGKRKEWAAQPQAIGSGRRCSEWDVNPLEADLGRNDLLMRLVEPRLQALHPLGDGGEVATEAGHHRFDGVVDLVLVDRGQVPVAHDHGAI